MNIERWLRLQTMRVSLNNIAFEIVRMDSEYTSQIGKDVSSMGNGEIEANETTTTKLKIIFIKIRVPHWQCSVFID